MAGRFLTGGYAAPEEAGVCRAAFDPEHGFRAGQSWKGFSNPSFILRHPRLPVLYTVQENSPEGRVFAWQMEDACLKPLGGLPSGGDSPCHLSLSAGERFLYCANYMSGTVAVFSLDGQGGIAGRTDLARLRGHGPNRLRQEGPHAHYCLEWEGLLYVCDLGADRIAVFENRSGRLEAKGGIALPAGCGPRHLAVSAAHPGLLYCVTELENSVYVIRKEENRYTVLQSLSTLPDGDQGESYAAAVHLSPDGRALMASNRGHDSIAVFPIGTDGLLGRPVLSPCVAQPRDFIILDSAVIVGSQRDSLIRAYSFDQAALTLNETPYAMAVPHPVCFAKL